MTTSAFELYEVMSDESDEPVYTFEEYEQTCENEYDADGNPMDEVCGGRVISTGGQGYYNGSYQCYTMYLRCENCGDYEVECV